MKLHQTSAQSRLTRPRTNRSAAARTEPEGDLDPCGIPCLDGSAASSRRVYRHRRPRLAGLSPAVVASVEEVLSTPPAEAVAWGCVGGRPVLFSLGPAVAREMRAALEAGEPATAIVEPWQVLLQPLD